MIDTNMSILRTKNLRAEIWVTCSFEQRLGALQDLEDGLAKQERRKPCVVEPIPEDRRVVVDGDTILWGQYAPSSDGSAGVVLLDPNLILKNEPYYAVEVLFHEARHAYQAHVARHPEIHGNLRETEDWGKTYNGGYINPDNGSDLSFAYYRWQPVETDANGKARERTDMLYSSIFQDNGLYPTYKSEREQELSDDIEYAEINLGENYCEMARQAMIVEYQRGLRQGEGKDYECGYGY